MTNDLDIIYDEVALDNSIRIELKNSKSIVLSNKMQDIMTCVSDALYRYNRWMVNHAQR